ncbi:MAG: serpin family protein [Gemmatimonadetes bacterium]|nr:serpin family protein [Gemmatimonadota bacterium]
MKMIQKPTNRLLPAIILSTALLGCGKLPEVSSPTAPPPNETPSASATEEVRSEKTRVAIPLATDSELTDLVRGNNDFAFNLYQKLREEESGNLFYSPYSISLALAMTYAGARGETERQMSNALHFILSQDKLHPAFNALDLQLASRGEGSSGQDGKGFRLNITNAIWGQQGYNFLQDFLDKLAENYGAGMRIANFTEAPENSRVTINDWVAQQTEEKIKDLIPSGAIDNLTRLVLTNAIYFNAAWLHPFDERATAEGDFHLLAGNSIKVPMMRQTESFGYARGTEYQAVELLYDGSEISMVILLPDKGTFDPFEKSLNAELIGRISKDLRRNRIELTMPSFEFEAQFKLGAMLQKMGISDAFNPQLADFSGMDGTKNLSISDAFHKAFVLVNENGTEAAAATGVVIGVTSVPPRVTIDRPFIFLIRDIATNTTLFVGRVMDPR